jgi:hypothetical protein
LDISKDYLLFGAGPVKVNGLIMSGDLFQQQGKVRIEFGAGAIFANVGSATSPFPQTAAIPEAGADNQQEDQQQHKEAAAVQGAKGLAGMRQLTWADGRC